jgi:hypothetical protein
MNVNFELPESFQSVFGMGTLQGFYRPNRRTQQIVLAIGVLLAGGAVLGALFGVYDAYVMAQRYGQIKFWDTLIPYLIFGALALLIGVGMAAWSLFHWRHALGLYEHGFAYHNQSELMSVRWSEVASFYMSITRNYTNGVYTGTTHIYTVHLMDGRKLVFGDVFENVEALGNGLQEMLFPVQYRRASEQFNAGQTVTFDKISLHKTEGLTIDNKKYPWHEIENISLNQGMLQVAKKGGGWFSGASKMVASIPNLQVLLTLVDEALGEPEQA